MPFVFDSNFPPADPDRMLGYAALFDPDTDELYGWHITDNPEIILQALRSGTPLTESGSDEQDFGAGLYISAVPHLWEGRAISKWEFLTRIGPAETMVLTEALTAVLDNYMASSSGYLTSSEYDYAIGILRNVQAGVFDVLTPLIILAEQPYNIKFWKASFLEPLGIEPAAQPVHYEVRLQGTFARCDSKREIDKAVHNKFTHGAYIAQGLLSTAQLCVWYNDAVISFAGERF